MTSAAVYPSLEIFRSQHKLVRHIFSSSRLQNESGLLNVDLIFLDKNNMLPMAV